MFSEFPRQFSRRIKVTCLVFALAVPITAQSAPSSDQRRETQDPLTESPATRKKAIPFEIELLLDRARSLPAVYSADIILRIVESPVVTDVEARTALIEEAFRLAARSPYLVKRVSLPGSNVDTTDGYLSHGYSLNLDVLSLQCRAVKAMLGLNKVKARELMSSIVLPKLPELNCDNALVEDVSSFYETLRDVAQRTFTPKKSKMVDKAAFWKSMLEASLHPSKSGRWRR